mgnify:CR=1 FL=1
MYRPIHEHSAAIVLQDAAPAFIISGTGASVFKSPAGVTFTVSGPTDIIEIPIKEIVTIASNKVTTLSQ